MSDAEDDDAVFAGDFDDFAEDGSLGAEEDGAEAEGQAAPGQEDEDRLPDEELGGLLDDDESCSEGEDEDDEVAAGAKGSRLRVLHPRDYMTSDMMSHVEVAKVLAVRAEQIANNNNAFLPEGVKAVSYDPVDVAFQELLAGMCPLIIYRTRSHGNGEKVVEAHKVRDLLVPPDDRALHN